MSKHFTLKFFFIEDREQYLLEAIDPELHELVSSNMNIGSKRKDEYSG